VLCDEQNVVNVYELFGLLTFQRMERHYPSSDPKLQTN